MVFAACASAAGLHAAWNSVSRLVRGDVGVLFVGQLMSLGVLVPLAIAMRDAARPVADAWPLIASSGLVHAGYLWALNSACECALFVSAA